MSARETLAQMAARGDLLRFASALQETNQFHSDINEALLFFEKPWCWSDEYETWEQHGKPTDDSDPGWAKFVEEIA